MVDLDESGAITYELLPLIPRRDMRTIKGELNELLNQPSSEDYLRVILTDRGELLEPMAKLRKVYPNIMILELDQKFNEFKGSKLDKFTREQKTPEQLFSDFYLHHKGNTLHEEGTQLIQKIIHQVREEI